MLDTPACGRRQDLAQR